MDDTGKLNLVQATGDRAVEFASTNTDVYGVGAFLLAGSEINRMTKTNEVRR